MHDPRTRILVAGALAGRITRRQMLSLGLESPDIAALLAPNPGGRPEIVPADRPCPMVGSAGGEWGTDCDYPERTMNDERFDIWLRRLARAESRRQALRLMASSALGLALAGKVLPAKTDDALPTILRPILGPRDRCSCGRRHELRRRHGPAEEPRARHVLPQADSRTTTIRHFVDRCRVAVARSGVPR